MGREACAARKLIIVRSRAVLHLISFAHWRAQQLSLSLSLTRALSLHKATPTPDLEHSVQCENPHSQTRGAALRNLLSSSLLLLSPELSVTRVNEPYIRALRNLLAGKNRFYFTISGGGGVFAPFTLPGLLSLLFPARAVLTCHDMRVLNRVLCSMDHLNRAVKPR